VPLFAEAPQQSDYSLLWQNEELSPENKAGESSAKAKLQKMLLPLERNIPGIKSIFGAIRRYRHRRAFTNEALVGLGAWPDLVRLSSYDLPSPEGSVEGKSYSSALRQ
jgi:hypothetical protein